MWKAKELTHAHRAKKKFDKVNRQIVHKTRKLAIISNLTMMKYKTN